MRTRDKSINIRVTSGEKKHLERKAKKCGVSLSVYLRKAGLNKKIEPAPSENLYQAYKLMSNMLRNFSQIDPAEYENYLGEIQEKILQAYYEQCGEANGSNEDLEN